MTPDEEDRIVAALRRAATRASGGAPREFEGVPPRPRSPEDTPSVPEHALRFARSALRWRVPGAELAEPAGRGSAEAAVRAGPRSPGLVRFAVRDLLIEVELTADGDRLDVAGQVVPVPRAATADVRTTAAEISRAVSPAGQFAVTGLEPGWFSLVLRRPGRRPVVTRWLRTVA